MDTSRREAGFFFARRSPAVMRVSFVLRMQGDL